MVQADSKNNIIAPAVSTRRRFLSQAAGVGACGAVLTLATVSATADAAAPVGGALAPSDVDPILSLIARHRAEQQAYSDALMDRAELHEDELGVTAADDRVEELCGSCQGLHWALATTTPTSIAGVAAVLRYANEFEDLGEEWPNTDEIGPDGWHYQLRATMAAAIEALIKAQAGKAVRA
jgi:hypothetical protein